MHAARACCQVCNLASTTQARLERMTSVQASPSGRPQQTSPPASVGGGLAGAATGTPPLHMQMSSARPAGNAAGAPAAAAAAAAAADGGPGSATAPALLPLPPPPQQQQQQRGSCGGDSQSLLLAHSFFGGDAATAAAVAAVGQPCSAVSFGGRGGSATQMSLHDGVGDGAAEELPAGWHSVEDDFISVKVRSIPGGRGCRAGSGLRTTASVGFARLEIGRGCRLGAAAGRASPALSLNP
eukprot:162105-Chlamydomonas_euryale.AAC.2